MTTPRRATVPSIAVLIATPEQRRAAAEPAPAAPGARTITMRTYDGAYARNRIPANTHALAHELPGVAVGTACGRVFGFATTAGMTVDAEPRPVTCSACEAATA